MDTDIRALENRAAASGDPLDRARAERARARATETPKPPRRSHVRTWSGARSALVTDMTNAGKRGKVCRQFHVAEPWNRPVGPGGTLPQGWGDWLDLFSRLESLEKGSGEESYDDIALLVRAACGACPEIKHDEREVRGVDVVHQDHAGYWDYCFYRAASGVEGFGLQRGSSASGRWSREEACLRARRHLAQLAYVPGGADGSEWLDLGDTDGRKDHARWCEFQRQYEAARREGKTDVEAHAQACGRPT